MPWYNRNIESPQQLRLFPLHAVNLTLDALPKAYVATVREIFDNIVSELMRLSAAIEMSYRSLEVNTGNG